MVKMKKKLSRHRLKLSSTSVQQGSHFEHFCSQLPIFSFPFVEIQHIFSKDLLNYPKEQNQLIQNVYFHFRQGGDCHLIFFLS